MTVLGRCPRCGAAGVEPCRTAGGNVAAKPHVDRGHAPDMGPIETSLASSLELAHWLSDVDDAKVATAIELASEMDRMIVRRRAVDAGRLFNAGGREDQKDAGQFVFVASELGRQLDSLGLSPKGRKELGLDDASEDDDPIAEAIKLHR